MYIRRNKNIKNIDKFIEKYDSNDYYIKFRSKNNIFICQNKDDSIFFDLSGFYFKKSFIRAFVLRQIRYKTVSNKLRISRLFAYRLKINCKYKRLYLVIDDHKYLICYNGISKNTIISSLISKSNFESMYFDIRTFIYGNKVKEINETIYYDYYK